MADDFYGFDEDDAPPKGRDNLFLWTVFILLLIGVAFACWLGSFYIFGHPEQPRAYRILKKLNKIDAPRRFEVTAAPPGEFLSAQRLFEKYSKYSRLELERENAELMRNYINNYRETKKLIPYLRGRFEILDSHELSEESLFPTGIVALAQSLDFQQVLIEHVFTTPKGTVPHVKQLLQTGHPITIERTKDLSAIVHIEKIFDGRLLFTAVPLLYGRYALQGSVGTFSLEPPPDINLGASRPITEGPVLEEALKTYANFRRTRPAAPEATESSEAPSGPELVRLDTIPEGAKVPTTGELPEMPVATPIPVPGRTTPRATPPLLAMNATPRPAATPIPATPLNELPLDRTTRPPSPAATPPPAMSPQGVPLKPFIASNPAPGQPGNGNWRTYNAGQLPAGRRVTAAEATDLAERGDFRERTYLRGNFVVTASAENRAILRPQSATGEVRGPGSRDVRVIVEYPDGMVPPVEGATFARDESRPFEIVDVFRGADGQVNISVREVTR
ncbi:MAG TPA: hypothetical protein VF614_11985 [Chthoniobacteraceae bacterium]|jgi:hypothetical protein